MTAWVALTGGIGSGKSQAALYFKQLNIPIINADAINRTLISTPNSPALQQINSLFGHHVLDDTGKLNRTVMRQLIFNNKQLKQNLENILHPLIIEHILIEQQRYNHYCYGIIEIPTLVENPHFLTLSQRVLLIHCNENTRIERIINRNQLSKNEILNIIRQQATDAQRLTIADDIIDNTTTLANLQQQVHQHHLTYQRIFC